MKDLILTKNRKRYHSPKMRLRRAKPWILNQRQGFFAMHGRVSALFTKITPANLVFPTTAFISECNPLHGKLHAETDL